jgi:outer membrane protein insertion porin family
VFADAGTVYNYSGFKAFNNLGGKTYGAIGSPIGGCTATNSATSVPAYTQGNCLTVVDEKALRASVGVGLLWQSPIGPVRFDYSFPVAKGRYDRTQAFRFSGGGSF